MTYLPGIPAAGDRPSQSQSQIQTNFTQLNSQYGTAGDHVAFDSSTNNGKHKKVTLPQDVAQSTAANEVSIYTKTTNTNINPGATVLTQPEVYVRQQSNGIEYLATRGNPVSTNGEGVCFGGLQIRCGQAVIPAGTPGTVAVSFTQRFSTACIGVVATTGGQNVVAQTTVFTPTGFTASANNGGGATNISYIAIGY